MSIPPTVADGVPAAAPAAPAHVDLSPHGGRVRSRYIATELFIVTAGVLIALSVDGLRQWRDHRALVEEARRNIAQEIRDNSHKLDGVLDGLTTRRTQLDQALMLVEDRLAKLGRALQDRYASTLAAK